MGKNTSKNISKNLSVKYCLKINDHIKQSATDAYKTDSKRAIQKIAEATGDLFGNKIVNKTTRVPKNSQQNNSETVTNEHDRERHKERHIYPEERQEIIDEVGLNSIIMKYQNILKVSENSHQYKSETVTNENDKEIPEEIPKERSIYPEERQKVIDNLVINRIV